MTLANLNLGQHPVDRMIFEEITCGFALGSCKAKGQIGGEGMR